MRARPATRLLTLLLAALSGTVLLPSPASAADGGIDHVEADGRELRLLLSLGHVPTGAVPDLNEVTVTFDGTPIDAEAVPVGEADTRVPRTAVIAIDASASMRGARLAAAKEAARTFLADVPDGVQVGLVTYAGEVEVAQQPTSDVAQVAAAVDRLELSRGTRLYDGVRQAVALAGDDGARSVLVLASAEDSSGVSPTQAATSVRRSGVKVDIIALSQTATQETLLGRLAEAGHGSVLHAGEPAALTALFADEAARLAGQVLLTAAAPARLAGQEGTLSVTVPVGKGTVTDTAFATFPAGAAVQPAEPGTSDPAVAGSAAAPVGRVSWTVMLAGLTAAGLSVVVILMLALGGSRAVRPDSIDRGIEAYTRAGARKREEADRDAASGSMTKAVSMAESVLGRGRGFESALADRLDAAGLALKPAEWLLGHSGAVVLAGLFALLLSGGNIVLTLLALALGAVGPLAYLVVRKNRRLRAFAAGLADTLQLMAGSLSAGLSLAQSVDAVVKEGADPIASEFRRALVEARLGVDIDESLAGVAERMESVDFQWVVMAIRIQRDVGGNLSELLTKVAETIREREYLLRQVKTLSAEGRLSVWILGGLPPAFTSYLALVNPDYLAPMFTNPMGIVMLVVMAVLLTVGVVWMKRVAKVDV